jgi:hypothetical protein
VLFFVKCVRFGASRLCLGASRVGWIPHATQRADVGGRTLTLYLARLLSTRGGASDAGMQSLRAPSFADLQRLQSVKEEHVRVSVDVFDEAAP